MKNSRLIEEKVFTYIRKHHMLAPGERVVAGISGGADSVCLLFVLLEWSKQFSLELAVVHVNHGVREEAGEDADYVKELCRQHKLPFYLIEEDVPGRAALEKASEEEMGRRVRYEAFTEIAEEFGANKIAVAHNSNDRSETMLFHLFRGSGVKGLSSIQPVRGKIIRPILCLERSEIEAYLEEKGISYCQDATNATDDYTRNRIRHHVLPYVEEQIVQGCVQHMARTAEILSETEDYLEKQTEAAIEACTEGNPSPKLYDCSGKQVNKGQQCKDMLRVLKIEAFRQYHPIIQKRMLHTIFKALSPHQRDISYVHIQEALELFERQGNRTICLPFGIRVKRQYDKVLIEVVQEQNSKVMNAGDNNEINLSEEEQLYRIVLPKQPSEDWSHTIYTEPYGKIVFSLLQMVNIIKEKQEVPQNQCTKWFDYDKIKGYITLRTRKTGDFLTITQGEGRLAHKALKDYMINQKIPQSRREELLLLAEDNHVIWLFEYRISEYYKINKNTKRILQVQLIGKEVTEYGMEEKNGGAY